MRIYRLLLDRDPSSVVTAVDVDLDLSLSLCTSHQPSDVTGVVVVVVTGEDQVKRRKNTFAVAVRIVEVIPLK